jgi:hypothetical protein
MPESTISSLVKQCVKEVLEENSSKPCNCGSGLPSDWAHDARGIPLARVCSKCRKDKLKGFRQDVLDDPNYETDEPIEPDMEEAFSGAAQITHNPDLQEKSCTCKEGCDCSCNKMDEGKWESKKRDIRQAYAAVRKKYDDAKKQGKVTDSLARKLKTLQSAMDKLNIQGGKMEEKKWIQGAVHPSRKGMFDGKTLADLKVALTKAKKLSDSYKQRGEKVPHELRTKISQLVFAIRAKSKNGLTESINEEASMAAGELDAIAHYVEHLQGLVNDNSTLEDWQKAKITLAHHYLESVFSSLNHGSEDQNIEKGDGYKMAPPTPESPEIQMEPENIPGEEV